MSDVLFSVASFTVAGGVFSLWIYAVPVSATCTRLIINAGGNFPVPPPPRLSLADPSALLKWLDPRPALLKAAKNLAYVSNCKKIPLVLRDRHFVLGSNPQ